MITLKILEDYLNFYKEKGLPGIGKYSELEKLGIYIKNRK